MDDSRGGKCEPVIVFECMELSIGQRVNVSGLSCVSNKVLWCWDSHNRPALFPGFNRIYDLSSALNLRNKIGLIISQIS